MTSDIIIIGAGQAGLATAYYLRRANVDFTLLDAEAGPGGAWQHAWDSLRCFSPATYSSLPGWQMPQVEVNTYPARDDVISYLARYEQRYGFEIMRPVKVRAVVAEDRQLAVLTERGDFRARMVISATGTWNHPYVPDYEGREEFAGQQLHSAHYASPAPFAGQTVVIVGGGNSAAQILAEVSKVATTIWVTPREPAFLPDDVDGRVLFSRATARIQGRQGQEPQGGFGDIVMVESVREARERGVLASVRPFRKFTRNGVVWEHGTETRADSVIWCTGFRPALDHLGSLGVIEADGKVAVAQNQSVKEPRLWLMGYGDWTGAASATLVGAGRMARITVPLMVEALKTL